MRDHLFPSALGRKFETHNHQLPAPAQVVRAGSRQVPRNHGGSRVTSDRVLTREKTNIPRGQVVGLTDPRRNAQSVVISPTGVTVEKMIGLAGEIEAKTIVAGAAPPTQTLHGERIRDSRSWHLRGALTGGLFSALSWSFSVRLVHYF